VHSTENGRKDCNRLFGLTPETRPEAWDGAAAMPQKTPHKK